MSSFEVPEPLDTSEVRDRFTQVVAVLIVTVTLLAASVGYLESRASASADVASAEAQQRSIQALAGASRAESAALAEYEAHVRSGIEGVRAANAFRRALQGIDEDVASIERDVWEEVASASEEASAPDPDGASGRAQDPVFPARFLAERSRGAHEANARQDAANELASAWSDTAVTYTAILTMFAVALYLLGSSLAMQRSLGRILAVGGVTLAAVAGAWGVTETLSRPVPAPDEAAVAYADAMVALGSAHDPASYRDAEAAFTKAIELRPSFGRAYIERASVAAVAESPQLPGVPVSIMSADARRRAVADYRKALELGYESSQLHNNLGFALTVVGLEEDRPDLLEDAIDHLRAALARDAANPIPHYNLGMAHLAAGRAGDAEDAYVDAVTATLYTDAASAARAGGQPEQLRRNPYVEQAWVSGALTDLQTLADLGVPREDVVPLKELIVGSVGRATGELGAGDADVSLHDIRLDVFPAEVQHQARVEDPGEDDLLSVQWFFRPSAEFGWAGIAQVSGPLADNEEEVGLRSYPHGPGACLPGGEYRAEFYADGRLVATEETVSAVPALQGEDVNAINLSLCRPVDWEESDNSVNGFTRGFVSPDGTRGVYVVRLPRLEGIELSAAVGGYLDSFESWRRVLAPDLTAAVDGTGSTVYEYFAGFEHAETRRYRYEGGSFLVGVGTGAQDPGAVLMGVVFGPDAMFDSAESPLGHALFASITRLN